jgi:hypothetical protein
MTTRTSMGEAQAFLRLRQAEDMFQCMEQLENELGSGSVAFQDKLTATIELFRELKANPALANLHSPNEAAHELQINQLRYLLLEYYLGMLAQKVNTMNNRTIDGIRSSHADTLRTRLEILQVASTHLDAFLDNCVHVGLLKRSVRTRQVTQMEQGKLESREDKINRWHIQQEAEAALKSVLQLKEKSKSRDSATDDVSE